MCVMCGVEFGLRLIDPHRPRAGVASEMRMALVSKGRSVLGKVDAGNTETNSMKEKKKHLRQQ